MRNSYRFSASCMALAATVLVAGCSGSTSAPLATTATFDVTLTNLTAGQPLSPLVAIAHNDGFAAFTIGQSASVELEKLAEGGQSAPLKTLADSSSSVYSTAVGSALPPGPNSKSTVTLTVPLTSLPTLRLSLAAMLGKTNDGFTGVSAQSLASLAVGATVVTDLISYDAGTELNTETAATVPGLGGEGFNPARDDITATVRQHSGIVSQDDGLPTSGLTHVNRWDNPVALLSIKRTQ